MYWNGLVFGIDINKSVKSLLCSIKRLQIPIYKHKSIKKAHLSLQDAEDKVKDNITKTVSEVEQRHSIKETKATNDYQQLSPRH